MAPSGFFPLLRRAGEGGGDRGAERSECGDGASLGQALGKQRSPRGLSHLGCCVGGGGVQQRQPISEPRVRPDTESHED